MKDRELRKLSRLELLELLLEANKENKSLKETVAKLTDEGESAKSIETIAHTADQISEILDQANDLVEALKVKSQSVADEKNGANDVSKKDRTDRNLYVRIMNFYEKNENAANTLPDDLKKDVRKRLKEISKNRKNNG